MRLLQIVIIAFGIAGSAAAQTPASTTARPKAATPKASAPKTTAPKSAAPAPAPAAPPAAPEAYSFHPEGRRDPFVSLVGIGTDPQAPNKKGEGAAAFGVGEVSVRGIMQSREMLIAMVQGPDNKTYLIHQGDKFADGFVKSVTTQGLVVVQEINDPLSTQKQREVRKLLRSLEDEKQ